MNEFPPVNLDFNEDGNIESKVVFKITHSVNATYATIKPEENGQLQGFFIDFKSSNPHLVVQTVDFWGDGDDASYYHYIDIYYSAAIWFEKVWEADIRVKFNGVEYWIMYTNSDGMRIVDCETKRTYFLNVKTQNLEKY